MKNVFEMAFYVSVAAGMALGTSSFLVLAGAFQSLPWPLVLAAVLGAMGFCIALASPIAELASMFPSSPGIRTYVKQAFGDRASLFVVFVYLTFVVLAAGAEAYMFSRAVTEVVPAAPPLAVGVGLILIIALVNSIGVTPSRGSQVVTTGILSLAVVTLGLGGLLATPRVDPMPLVEPTASLGQLPAVVGLGIFLFVGFEWVTPLGFGPKSYARKIPASMPLGILLNGALYTVFIVGVGRQLTSTEIGGSMTPQVSLATIVFGAVGRWGVLVLCAAATASTFNAGVMGGARMIYALGRERRLPLWCARFDVDRGVPHGGVLLLTLLTLASTSIIIVAELQLAAAILASALVCAVYGVLVLSARKLRVVQARRKRAFVSRFSPNVMLAVAVAMFALAAASLDTEPSHFVPMLVAVALSAALAFALMTWSASLGASPRAQQSLERLTSSEP